MTAKKIKVLVCDDHPLVLEGIASVLGIYDNIELVGAVRSAKEAIALAATALPDVVLMDINMAEMSGLDAIEVFRERVPKARLLMLSMHDSREYISTAVMYGASGYLLKDLPPDELVKAIGIVAGNGTYFSSGVNEVLLRSASPERGKTLTSREQSILLLVAAGKSNKDVAETLDISVLTVETHRKNIRKKLGISSTAGLIRYALEQGLIQPKGTSDA